MKFCPKFMLGLATLLMGVSQAAADCGGCGGCGGCSSEQLSAVTAAVAAVAVEARLFRADVVRLWPTAAVEAKFLTLRRPSWSLSK